MPDNLTAIERRILALVCATVARFGRPPSIRELAEAAELRSVASLHWYLDRLQEKGLIRPHPTRARAIEVDCQGIALDAQAEVEPTPLAPSAQEEGRPAPEEPTAPPTPKPAAPAPAAPEPAAARSAYENKEETPEPEHEHPDGRATSELVPESDFVEVPRLGEIAAGSPVLADEEVVARYLLPRDLVGAGAPLFMVQVRGSSMDPAGILEGDFVVVRQQPDADDGEIVAVHVEEGATVKRLSKRTGRVRLLSDNPAYDPMEPEQASILGKVVTVIRRVR